MPKEFFCALEDRQVAACPNGLRTCHIVVRRNSPMDPPLSEECACIQHINIVTGEKRMAFRPCGKLAQGCFWCWQFPGEICPECGAELEKKITSTNPSALPAPIFFSWNNIRKDVAVKPKNNNALTGITPAKLRA